MEEVRTIRNCAREFRLVCPKVWEELSHTDRAEVRHCDQCRQDVYFCQSDEETILHAKAGHCIARVVVDEMNIQRDYVGIPANPAPLTAEQQATIRAVDREHGIDDSLKNAAVSTRACPQCNYPAPNWRRWCRVCGFEMGRVKS